MGIGEFVDRVEQGLGIVGLAHGGLQCNRVGADLQSRTGGIGLLRGIRNSLLEGGDVEVGFVDQAELVVGHTTRRGPVYRVRLQVGSDVAQDAVGSGAIGALFQGLDAVEVQ